MTSMLATSRIGVCEGVCAVKTVSHWRPFPREGGRAKLGRMRVCRADASDSISADRAPCGAPSSGALHHILPKGEGITVSLVVADLAAVRPAGVLLGVGHRGLVEQRLDPGRVGADEVADLHPFRPVPLLDEGRRVAVVVEARRLERPGEAVEAERLESRLVEVEVLETAAHVLAGDHFLARDLLGFR